MLSYDYEIQFNVRWGFIQHYNVRIPTEIVYLFNAVYLARLNSKVIGSTEIIMRAVKI